jgi:hypothetical protein
LNDIENSEKVLDKEQLIAEAIEQAEIINL